MSGLIRQFWLESGCVYGSRKIHDDLRSSGELFCINHVATLMKKSDIKAQVGYKWRRFHYGGRSSVVASNILQREFQSPTPNSAWVTDVTYIRLEQIIFVNEKAIQSHNLRLSVHKNILQDIRSKLISKKRLKRSK